MTQRIERPNRPAREWHARYPAVCAACQTPITVGDVVRRIHGRIVHNRTDCIAAIHPA